MMKVLIDLTALLPQPTGVDVYMKQLLLALARMDTVNRYLVCLNFGDRKLFEGRLPENFCCRWFSARPRPFRLFFQQVLLPLVSLAWKADVVHSPAFIAPFFKGRAGHVLTIHDMTFFTHPECHTALRGSAAYLAMVRNSMRHVQLLIAPSLATRHAILDFMPDIDPERIRVTPLGIGDEFKRIDAEVVERTRQRLGLPRRYILYLGTLEPRKNISMLVESYRQLIERGTITEDLVIAGRKGWGYDALMQQLQAPSLRGRVHVTGYLDQEDLPAVYAGAKIFVYPSLLEGFGLPPLEAMACGTPTISTHSSSLAENLEGIAELVPVNDVDALSAAIARLLGDYTHWSGMRELGLELASRYRWEHTARKTLECYDAATIDL